MKHVTEDFVQTSTMEEFRKEAYHHEDYVLCEHKKLPLLYYFLTEGFHAKDRYGKLAYILQEKTAVNKSINGITPLGYLCGRGIFELELIQLLVRNGADVNAIQRGGIIPLISLSLSNMDDHKKVACFSYLIEAGSDINAKTGTGKDIVDVAMYHRKFNKELLDILYEHKHKLTEDKQRKLKARRLEVLL